jgi:hypothetical protein
MKIKPKIIEKGRHNLSYFSFLIDINRIYIFVIDKNFYEQFDFLGLIFFVIIIICEIISSLHIVLYVCGEKVEFEVVS